MPWQQRLNGDSLAWLLEPDAANPAIRYYALRDLLDRPADAPEVVAAQAAVMQSGPVPAILDAQEPDGYWQQPGGGYGKYRGTAWQIILLGDLGADPADERVHRACEYVLGHGIAANGGYAYNRMPLPSGVIHCLNGNVVHALIRLGLLGDPRVQGALEWQARAITGEAPIQILSIHDERAGFLLCRQCQAAVCLGCHQGVEGVRCSAAEHERSPLVQRAVAQGAAFLLDHDLAAADYPYTEKISSAWFKLGFPLSYWSDLLETLAALVALGYGGDPYAWRRHTAGCSQNKTCRGAGSWRTRSTARCGPTSRRRASPASGSRCAPCG